MCYPGCSLPLFRPPCWVLLVSVKVGLGRGELLLALLVPTHL